MLDLGRGSGHVCVGGGHQGARGTRRDGGGISRAGDHERRLDHAHRAGGREDRTEPVKFIGTRGGTGPVTLSAAVLQGIAADGGLFVPERLPALSWRSFPPSASLPSLAQRVIAPFADGDRLAAALAAVCRDAFTFPAPLVRLDLAPRPPRVLQPFPGPTGAV